MEQDSSSNRKPHGITVFAAELAVLLLFLSLGGLVVYDSLRLGIRWVGDGPQAGYFPFYIGAIICIASLITLGQVVAARKRGGRKIFVEWAQLRQVLAVLLPAGLFVLAIQLIGIYVASTLYISIFMVWLGKYSWIKGFVTGLAVSVATFLMFEIWFKVPLFKGAYNPLGFLGY